MVDNDPEDIGKKLTESVDMNALEENIDEETTEEIMQEVRESFSVQFGENQQGIQHELLDTALNSHLQLSHSVDSLTKDKLVRLASDSAREAYYKYAQTLILMGEFDVRFNYSDMPDAEFFVFRDAIVDGYWNDVAQQRIEQNKQD